MKKSILTYTCCLALATAAQVVAADTDIYAYAENFMHPMVAPGSENTSFILNEAENLTYAEDVVYPAKFCDDESEYFCVESSLFEFAVPKDFPCSVTKWKYGNETYSVIRRSSEYSVLGRAFDATLIEMRPIEGNRVMQFIYSPENGLIAYGSLKIDEAGLGRFYWVQSTCGFGAQVCGGDSTG